MRKTNLRLGFFILISATAYILLGYFTPREDTTSLFALYSCLFTTYLIVWYISKEEDVNKYLKVAFGFRLLLLLAVPLLSDDIYRFIWDGRLLVNGISPFAALPIDYIASQDHGIIGINNSLFELLNSPEYFTVYPPLSQFVFWLSVIISPDNILGSIIFIRLSIILAELGSFYLLMKLLKHYELPTKNVLIYALNPLVIIELTGNLHFEAFVIFFLLLAIYSIIKKKILLSSLNWSLAIGFKLIPLIFLPLLFRKLNIKPQFLLYISVGIITILLFIPLYDKALINGLSSSLTLYFQKFEFNASIYYLIRAIGYWFKGYNIIAQLGPALAVITFASVITYSSLSIQKTIILPTAMMFTLLIYLLLTTTVHPWYITTLIALCSFSSYRFPILWSLLIFLTYAGYSVTGYKEPIMLIVLEYVILTLFIGYEIFFHQKNSKHLHKVNPINE